MSVQRQEPIRAAQPPQEASGSPAEVLIPAGEVSLAGYLQAPEPCRAVVVFAHGSGSSRHSPRNRYVASVLNDAGIATLLMDLLTAEEEGDRRLVFDIPLLAERLIAGVRWAGSHPPTAGARLGFFGASTGAGAALYAAAERGAAVSAVVSRGGRPDLAGERLGRVTAPTLLIVGGADREVLALNRRARAALAGPSELAVVPGAGHLFQEPGALTEVARLARDWFTRFLLAG